FARTSESAGTFADARPDFDPALGSDFVGWGDTFVDLTNSGSSDLVLATGGIPVKSLKKDAGPLRVLAPVGDQGGTQYGVARGLAPSGLRVNGRGLAAADVDNDGRMEGAVNSIGGESPLPKSGGPGVTSIGGKLLLLKSSAPVGHWLDVRLSRFSPGAVVTVDLGKASLSQEVRAGSRYLSSQGERVHFGLSDATRVERLTFRYPWGRDIVLHDVRTDRIVEITVPPPRIPKAAAPASYRIANCTPAPGDRSIATVWEKPAVDALRPGAASEPVQARG